VTVSVWIGWGLAAAALVVGCLAHGWRGLVLAISIIAFWLLLQFSRTLRALRQASLAPVGHVESAVMLHARLHDGVKLVDIVKLAGSLGRKVRDDPETLAWRDRGDVEVEVVFEGGRCRRWALRRPETSPHGEATS
jgi:hypothetical protein